jgi:hypothetical protein
MLHRAICGDPRLFYDNPKSTLNLLKLWISESKLVSQMWLTCREQRALSGATVQQQDKSYNENQRTHNRARERAKCLQPECKRLLGVSSSTAYLFPVGGIFIREIREIRGKKILPH